MAERKKLQTDIERALKRLDENLTCFRGLIAKAEEAELTELIPAQKEKLETDLKKEIKKLQRQREELRRWLASPEVRDTGPLEEKKAAVEREMERYKACEKLFKVKAFSKEGLSQPSKINHEELEREKHRKWIRETLDRLSHEIDEYEAELEIARSRKKGGHQNADKMAQYEIYIMRHKFHAAALERLLRRLENHDIESEELDNLKIMVDAYLENSNDVDYYHDEDLYAALEIDEPESSLIARESRTSPVPPSRVSAPKDGETPSPPRSSGRTESSGLRGSASAAGTMIPAGGVPGDEGSLPRRTSSGDSRDKDRLIRRPFVSTFQWGRDTKKTDNGEESGIQSTLENRFDMPTELAQWENQQLGAITTPEQAQALVDVLTESVHTQFTPEMRCHFRYYQSRPPLKARLPECFPRKRLKGFASTNLFKRLDLDTLFFVFYYQQGTYQQHLAARQLMAANWHFHRKYLTWFQPQGVGERAAQPCAVWCYFDNSAGWCSRVKSEFRFELKFLEDAEHIMATQPNLVKALFAQSEEPDVKVPPIQPQPTLDIYPGLTVG